MTPEERTKRLADLRRIRDASAYVGAGYKDRIAAIDAEIAKLEAEGVGD